MSLRAKAIVTISGGQYKICKMSLANAAVCEATALQSLMTLVSLLAYPLYQSQPKPVSLIISQGMRDVGHLVLSNTIAAGSSFRVHSGVEFTDSCEVSVSAGCST